MAAGYKSASIAFENYGVAREILLLADGNAPNDCTASKSQPLAKCAEVGYWPCFAGATHVAILVTCDYCGYSPLTADGAELRRPSGPWGAYRPAANAYRAQYGS